MSPEELLAFLDEERTLTCATTGPDAWPHLMPLWYVVRDGECWAWTYAKSQKVRNLEREARCTIQVETGTAYPELRGVMMKCVCAIHRDPAVVAGVGTELGARYSGSAYVVTPAQASKRVALQFIANSTASWDHRKL
jgi:pyridoxamine 5'-phosphate oxidase-like protein